MRPEPSITCVVVNWNGFEDTLACLDSLRLQDYPSLSIIVVDNGSTNDSVARIRTAHPAITVLELPQNLGFSRGCNAGTRLAYSQGSDLIWLLNNDTIAPPSTASAIVRAFLAHPEAGAIGCVLRYMHDPTRLQAWGGGRISLASAFIWHFKAPASFVSSDTFFTGASLTLPRRTCEEVGIFFEGFFMYCDDVDLCLRIHRAGKPLIMALQTDEPGMAVLHKEGGSSPRRNPLIDQFATTSTLRLLRRFAPLPAFSIAVYLTLRLANRLVRGEWRNLASVIKGVRIVFAERHHTFTDSL